MKTLLETMFLLLITHFSFGQNLMETALNGKPVIIISEAFEIKQKLKSLDIRFVNEQSKKIDNLLLVRFKTSIRKRTKINMEKV